MAGWRFSNPRIEEAVKPAGDASDFGKNVANVGSTMFNPIAIPVSLTVLFGGSFVVNEWSHGAMSEGVGMGHHHMLDYGQYHCAAHNDTMHADHHAVHMHGNDTMPHGNCRGGAGMHQGPMGEMGGGAR